MLKQSLLLVGVVLFATPALADLKPDIIDCDAKKVARNAAMDATVGISGGCDTEKMADSAKDDLDDRFDDAKDSAGDRMDDAKDKIDRDHDKRDHKLRKDKDERD